MSDCVMELNNNMHEYPSSIRNSLVNTCVCTILYAIFIGIFDNDGLVLRIYSLTYYK